MFEFFKPKEEPKKPEYSREIFDAADAEKKEAFTERIQDQHRPVEMRDPKGVIRRDHEATTEKSGLLKEARKQALQEDAERREEIEDEKIAA